MKSKKKEQSNILLESYKKFPVFVNFYLNLDNPLDEKIWNDLQSINNISKKEGEYVYEVSDVLPIIKSGANEKLINADIHDEVEYENDDVNIYDAIYSYFAVFREIENVKFTLTNQQTFTNIGGDIALLHNVLLGKINLSEILNKEEMQFVTDFMILQKWLLYDSFEYKPFVYFKYNDFVNALNIMNEYFEQFELENLEKFFKFFPKATAISCAANPPVLVTVDYQEVV